MLEHQLLIKQASPAVVDGSVIPSPWIWRKERHPVCNAGKGALPAQGHVHSASRPCFKPIRKKDEWFYCPLRTLKLSLTGVTHPGVTVLLNPCPRPAASQEKLSVEDIPTKSCTVTECVEDIPIKFCTVGLSRHFWGADLSSPPDAKLLLLWCQALIWAYYLSNLRWFSEIGSILSKNMYMECGRVTPHLPQGKFPDLMSSSWVLCQNNPLHDPVKVLAISWLSASLYTKTLKLPHTTKCILKSMTFKRNTALNAYL